MTFFFHSISNFLGFQLFYFLYTTIVVRFTILVVMSAMVARSAIVVRSVFPAKCNNLLSIDWLIKTGKWLLKLSGKFSPPNHVCYLGKPSSAVSSLGCGVVCVCVCVYGTGAFKYYISRFYQILDPPPPLIRLYNTWTAIRSNKYNI